MHVKNVSKTIKRWLLRWMLLGFRVANAPVDYVLDTVAWLLFRSVRASIVHGLVEWGSDSAEVPLIIVGTSVDAVRRAGLNAIVESGLEYSNAGPDFDLPVPGSDASAEDVEEWLRVFQEYATVPWFSIIDPPRDVRFV
jgi:hypothetical protein